MSDLITINTNGLNEAIRCAICKNPIKSKRGCDGSCQYDKEMLSKVIDAVEGLADERPHGRWIKHIDDLFPEESTEECSVCHEEQRITGNDDDFCPKCGADMREEGERNEIPYA